MIKRLKNAEWSKKLLIFIQILILLTFCLVTAAVLMGNAEPLTAFITGVFTLASLSFGFYYWKAKNENIRKYAQKLSDDDIRKVVAISHAIFKADDNE